MLILVRAEKPPRLWRIKQTAGAWLWTSLVYAGRLAAVMVTLASLRLIVVTLVVRG